MLKRTWSLWQKSLSNSQNNGMLQRNDDLKCLVKNVSIQTPLGISQDSVVNNSILRISDHDFKVAGHGQLLAIGTL